MIKKVSDKQRERNMLKAMETKRMQEMFKEIWSELEDKVCWECGRFLGKEISSMYFDHLIEKSKRPELRLEKDNIFICCGECHTNKTNGHPGDKHKLAIEKAEDQFND